MSDFSNFRAVYNELTDAVTSSKHQFFKDHLENFFRNLDDTPRAHLIVADLEARVDFFTWYEECKETIGSMVGSGALTWPKDPTDRLAMRVALLRALSNETVELYDFCAAFLYSANDYDVHVFDVSRQIFLPTTRELLRFIEARFDTAEVPASDRTVTVNHNSKEYADVDEAMQKLEQAIREANDFDDPLEKEQREAEVSAARRLLKATRVRVSAIVELLKPLVVQYATKLKENIVGIAVTGTISALTYLFGKIF